MTAKSTHFARILNAKNFITDINNTDNSFYITIGKSDSWSTVATDFTDDVVITDLVDGPQRSQTYEAQVRQNFLAMKKLESSNISHAIRKYNWTSGVTYAPWDSNDPDIFTKIFYVITSEKKVYKCIKAGPAASTIEPTQVNDAPTAESDGYTWKFMYTLSAVQTSNFETPAYIPVKTVELADGQVIGDLSTADQIQYTTQQNASNYAGKIYIIKVSNGGSGYTSAPTISIDGDGTGCTASAIISGGAVTGITVTNEGDDYNVAKVIFDNTGTGGSGASAYAVLSPVGGHGADPVTELGGEFTISSFDLIGNEQGTFITNDDFRQVSMLKNPYNFGTSTISTGERLNAVPEMELSGVTNGEVLIGSNIGDVITGQTSNAKAFVTSYDNATGYLGYTQNDKTGYGIFQGGETVTSSAGASGTIATLSQTTPDVDIYSGKLLIVNNIEPVNRTETGQEKVKFIIEF